MTCSPHTRPSSQSGFSLLEILLVIGVTSVMFLGIMQITTSWVNSEISSGAGQHMQRVTNTVQNYIEANWENLTETTDAVNGGAAGWDELKTQLEEEGLIVNNQLRSPLGVDLQISFTKSGGMSRAIIFSTTPVPYTRANEAARQVGNSGGTLSFFPNANFAFGAFGQWRIPVTQLYPATAGAFPCTPNQGNSCLVAMVGFSDATLCGTYLYRASIADCPDGNRMATDLNMNNRDINNSQNILAENLNVSDTATLGNTTVAGNTNLNGPATMNNGLNIAGGGMSVTGDANFSGNVQMAGGGNLRALTLDVNTIEAERIEATNLRAENVNVNGSLAVDNTVTVNGDIRVNGAGSEIFAGAVNAGQFTAGSGEIQVGTMNVQNTMQISGQVELTGGAISADRVVITRCTTIRDAGGELRTYGSC